jgi:hypothetical protein
MTTPTRLAERPRGALWRHPVAPVLIWAVSRLLLATVALGSRLVQSGGQVFSTPDWLPRLLFNWDSGYFLAIAQHGYAGQDPSLRAFFPGYPALARLLATATGSLDTADPSAGLIVWMWVIPQLASLGGAVLIWRLARRDHGPLVATAATALVLLGPYAIFLASSYSESLYLLFAVAAWLVARRGIWWAAGLLGVAASFTRINGVFLVAALVVMYVVEQRRAGRPVIGVGLFAVLAGALGAFAYWLYLLILTGSPTAWQQAQSVGWNRGFQWPWITFYETAGRALLSPALDRRIQYGLDIVFAAALILAIVWFARSRRWPEFTLLTLTALSLMTSFSYLSLARNTSTLFPLAIAVAAAAATSTRARTAVVAIGILGVLLLIFNTHQFTLGLWSD